MTRRVLLPILDGRMLDKAAFADASSSLKEPG